MNFNRTRTAFAAVLIATALGGAAIAQSPDAPGRAEHGKRFDADRLPKHLEALGLSDSQKAQFKALREARLAKHKQERAGGESLRDTLKNLSPAAPNYTAEVDRIATLMGQQHARRIRDGAATRAQEWAILTPSQQSQLAAMPKPDFSKRRGHGKH